MWDDAAAWGATQLSRWRAVLKATVQVNVMSWQYVASEVLYFTRVCPSPSDVTSALVITAVTSVSLCCVPNRLLVKPWHLKKDCLSAYIFICCCQHIITRYDLLLVSFAFSRIKPLPSFFLDGVLGGWTSCWGLLTSTNLLKTFCCHEPAFAVVLSTVFLLKLKVNTALFCLINIARE